MIIQVLHCPNCQGTDIVRHGKTRQGKQRYRYREKGCASRTFLLAYAYAGQSPAVKQQIVDMAMNASGIRDTARVFETLPGRRRPRAKASMWTSTHSIPGPRPSVLIPARQGSSLYTVATAAWTRPG